MNCGDKREFGRTWLGLDIFPSLQYRSMEAEASVHQQACQTAKNGKGQNCPISYDNVVVQFGHFRSIFPVYR